MIRLAPALLLLLSACEKQTTAPLLISDIIITDAVSGQPMSAGFMTLRNNSNETIEVTAVTSRQFNTVAIHESSIDDGITRMRRLETLTIAPKSSVALQPGGIHLMLMRPTTADKGNDEVSLSFYRGETLILNVSTQISRRTQ